MMTMPEETFENDLERGYPIHVSPDAFIATAEQMLRIRAANRGIREVAIKDANVPIAGAFRRDTLMPVMVDYMNAVILPHSELKFESAMNDEVTARVAAGIAAEQRFGAAIDVAGNDAGVAPGFIGDCGYPCK